ncbi:anthrone oxygenase family protein, partial [Streptomonospora algeriensis]
RSLAEAVDFFSVTGPADLFPPLGAATVVAAVAATALSWPDRDVRLWLGASLLTLVLGEFLFSMLYFWPRNDIMFEEGTAVHSTEFLRRTAVEFETGHWGRLAMSGVTATLAFTGLLRLYRARATEEYAPHSAR